MRHRNDEVKEEWIQKIEQSAPEHPLLSAEEIVGVMEAETSKPLKERNNELIDRCAEMLCSLYGCKEARGSEADLRISKRRVQERIEKSRKWTRFFQGFELHDAIRPGTILVAIALIFWGGVLAMQPKTLRSEISEDGERALLYQAPLQTTSLAAAQNGGNFAVTASDFEEAFELLGYRFPYPSVEAQGLQVATINVSRNEMMDQISASYIDPSYTDEETPVLFLDVMFLYDSGATFTLALEQSEAGEQVRLENGKTAYVAENLEENWVLYHEKKTICQLSSERYGRNTLLQIMNSIGE